MNWVYTLWQQYTFTHNSTQNSEDGSLRKIKKGREKNYKLLKERIGKKIGKYGPRPVFGIIPWHLSKICEHSQKKR
jgi:hypothetical protein